MLKTFLLSMIVATLTTESRADAQNISYSYDALGRLAATSEAGGPSPADTAYEYDPAGNRKTVIVVAPSAALRTNQSTAQSQVAPDSKIKPNNVSGK